MALTNNLSAVSDTGWQDILTNLDSVSATEPGRVVYGIYDNRHQPLSTRLRDYWIDNIQRISIKDKAYFFQMLAVLLDAGVSLVKSLLVLANRTENERFARVLNTVAYAVEHGEKLSAAMQKFPMVFEAQETGVIRSGEAMGSLDLVLNKLSVQITKSLELKMKVRNAMVYPATIFTVLLATGVVILTMVMPQLTDLFRDSGTNVPASTAFLLAINNFISEFWWLILILLLGGSALLINYFRSPGGKRRWDRFVLRVPYLGDLIKKITLAKWSRTLGMLVDSGVSIVEALEISRGVVANTKYVEATQQILDGVKKGEKIAANLEQYPQLFTEDLISMVSVGEKTATLGEATRKVADYYDNEVDYSLKNLTAIIEPAAIILIGLVVGWFVVSILGSIFSITESIG